MPRDLHVSIYAALLAATGLPLAGFVVLVPLAALRVAVYGLPPGDADAGWIFAIVLPLTFGLGLVGVAQLVTALGLWRQRRWGWLAGLACCAVWMMGGLLPLGAYGLYALLRGPVRERFQR